MHERHPSLRMDVLCGLFGKSKQAFYQHHRKADDSGIDRERILLYIREIRERLPGCGVRKIHEILRRFYQVHHVGRDRLFDMMRVEGMLIRKRKCRKRTTYSDHNMRVYPNAIVDVIPTRPNEIWVSDITYLLFLEKDYYLFLVTEDNIRREIARIITSYNTRRIHYSIELMTPEEAHQKCGELERMWKKYPYHKTNEENCNNFASDKKAAVMVRP